MRVVRLYKVGTRWAVDDGNILNGRIVVDVLIEASGKMHHQDRRYEDPGPTEWFEFRDAHSVFVGNNVCIRKFTLLTMRHEVPMSAEERHDDGA